MRTIPCLLAATALAGISPARAQTPATAPASGPPAAASPIPDSEQIIVTGSRLRRPLSDTVEPTFTVNAEQIATRGYTNVGDALRELPEFGPGINGVGGAQSGFGPGQTFADFFNLGPQRTLTLIDGVRVVPNISSSTFGPGGPLNSTSGGSEVDLNTIPVALIDRVESVAVGGAPIYGSDAIAGTINFITKKKIEGLELSGQSSITGDRDASTYRLSALYGHDFAGGRGNIAVVFEYDRQDPLTYIDRPSTAADLFFTNPATDSKYAKVLFPNQRFPGLSEQGIPFTSDGYPFGGDFTGVGVFNAAGQPLRFGPGGALIPIDIGIPTGDSVTSSGGNGLDLATVGNLLTSEDRYLGTVLLNYQVNDHVKAFLQGWFAESDSTNFVAQGYYNTALFNNSGGINGNFAIPLTNPFLTPSARATIAANLPEGQNIFYLSRANEDIEPSSATGDQTTWRIVGGLSGDVPLMSHDLNWNVTGTYGYNQQVNRSPQVVNANLNNAVNATTDAAGNIVCAPGYTSATIATISATCAPLNLFGYGSPSKAAIDYITAIARSESQNELVDVVATLSDSSLIRLPGGGAGFSIGYEHRDERARFDPGAFYRGELNADGTYSQYGNSIPIPPVNGGFYTNEGFAEINLPFVSHKMGLRFLDTFEIKAAARYVDHSVAGADWTWTAGGRFGIVRDVIFTGNFTRSIRSPSVSELFAPVGQAFFTALDPCDKSNITNGPNPANRAKNCAAAGIPTGFVSNIDSFTEPGSQGGNPNLKNEIADSWTIGAQIQPRWIQRLYLNVNWINIDLHQAIVPLTATNVLDACYDATSYPASICSDITRNAAGQVTFIKTGNENAAEYRFAGLTASAYYSFPVHFIAGSGMVNINGNYLYTDRQQYRVGTGDLNINLGSIGFNRHAATANLNYNSDVFSAQLQARYLSAAVFNANDKVNARDINSVPAVVFLNSTVGLTVDKRYTLRLSVDNLLGQGAPYPATAQDTAVYFAGILGRVFRASVDFKF